MSNLQRILSFHTVGGSDGINFFWKKTYYVGELISERCWGDDYRLPDIADELSKIMH